MILFVILFILIVIISLYYIDQNTKLTNGLINVVSELSCPGSVSSKNTPQYY